MENNIKRLPLPATENDALKKIEQFILMMHRAKQKNDIRR